jgi:Copine
MLEGKTKVSHCFPLNGKGDPEIRGIDNLVDCYKKILPKLKMMGPSCFAPVLKKCKK